MLGTNAWEEECRRVANHSVGYPVGHATHVEQSNSQWPIRHIYLSYLVGSIAYVIVHVENPLHSNKVSHVNRYISITTV